MALSTTVLASIVVVLLLAILAALPEESRPAAARCPVWFFNQVGQAATVCRDVASEVSSAAGFAVCSCSARRFGRCLMSFMTAVAGFAALNAGLAQIGQGGLVPHDARDEGSPRDFGSRFSTSKFEGGGGAQRAVPGSFPTPACSARPVGTPAPVPRRGGGRPLQKRWQRRTIVPGAPLLDDRGLPIHAHGGGFLAPWQAGGFHDKWWWYGESAKNESGAHVNAYSSHDLFVWHYEGVVLHGERDVANSIKKRRDPAKMEPRKLGKETRAVKQAIRAGVRGASGVNNDESSGDNDDDNLGCDDVAALAEDLVQDPSGPPPAAVVSNQPRLVVERPKVVFCPTTQLYVMWFHLDHYRPDGALPHYHWRRAGVATAPAPQGPFTLRKVLKPGGLDSLDLTLHQLLQDDAWPNASTKADVVGAGGALAGATFLVRSVGNRFLAVSQLRDDFLDVADDEQPNIATSSGAYQIGGAPYTSAAGSSPSSLHGAVSSSSSSSSSVEGDGGGGGGYRSATDGPLEGAGVVRRGPGQWLVVASHLKGWLPSPMELLQLNQPSLGIFGGRFTALEPPTASRTSHFSQCAFVLQHCDAKGKPYFVYFGDRWGVTQRSGLAGLASASYVMLPLVVTPPPPSSSSSNSDVSTNNGDEAPLVLPWRDTWDLDDPFPGNHSGEIYSRWTEGPAPPVFGSKGGKGGSSGSSGGGGSSGKWSANSVNSGPRAKALDVLALVDSAAAAAAAASATSSEAGAAFDTFSTFSSSSETTSSTPPPPPKARGKWARAAGFVKGDGGGGGRSSGRGNGGGYGSSSRRGSSNSAWKSSAQAEATGGVSRVHGLLDDDLGASGAAAPHARLGPLEEPNDQPEMPAAGSSATTGTPAASRRGDLEPTFVVPASFVSPYVNSE